MRIEVMTNGAGMFSSDGVFPPRCAKDDPEPALFVCHSLYAYMEYAHGKLWVSDIPLVKNVEVFMRFRHKHLNHFLQEELPLESALLVPFYNEALQDQEDDHQRQDTDGGTDEEFVQIEHLGIQEVGKHHLDRPCRRVLTNHQRPQESVPASDKGDHTQSGDDAE